MSQSVHGTISGYQYWLCRCLLCGTAQRNYYLRYYQTAKGKKARKRIYVKQAARTARNRELLDLIKVERGCYLCGYNKHPAALHFDHVVGKKRKNVSQLLGHPTILIFKEIEKCQLICANCHAAKTWKKSGLQKV